MTRTQVEAAAFWDSQICLDCEAAVEVTDDDHCMVCGSEAVLPADTVLKCVEIVAKEDEE